MRSSIRVRPEQAVDISVQAGSGDTLPAEMLDVSAGGLALRIAAVLPIGAEVDLHLQLDNGGEIGVRAVVRYRIGEAAGQRYGLEFLDPPEVEGGNAFHEVFEHRTWLRAPADPADPVEVDCENADGLRIPGLLFDISARGIGLLTDADGHSFEVGQRVRLAFNLPDALFLDLDAEVRAVRGEGGKTRYALAFDSETTAGFQDQLRPILHYFQALQQRAAGPQGTAEGDGSVRGVELERDLAPHLPL